MTSVASGGTVDRIAARILFNAPRAGSEIPAMYSSTLFGAEPLAAEPRLPDFIFFMGAMQEPPNSIANDLPWPAPPGPAGIRTPAPKLHDTRLPQLSGRLAFPAIIPAGSVPERPSHPQP